MSDAGPLYLVFGASGYVGGHLVPRLLAAGRRVRAVARDVAALDRPGWEAADGRAADALRPENLELAHAEYGEGDFERAFTLSEDFDPDRIEAEMRGGVLTLTLPRAPEAQPKRIVVKGA